MSALPVSKILAIRNTVYNTARACGLNDLQAKLIVAQSEFESGGYTSGLFHDDNNLFGMTIPSKRPTTYIKGASATHKQNPKYEGGDVHAVAKYASYSSVSDSVKDLILGWHAYNKTDWSKIKTLSDYTKYLKSKGYYGVSVEHYENGLTAMLKKYGVFTLATGGGAAILIVAIAFFFLYNK